MKKLLFIPLFAFVFTACNNASETPEVNEETTEVAEVQTEVLNYFGEEIEPDGAVAAADLLAMMEGKDSLNVKVEGTINECCQKKGCWMDVDLGDGKTMVVRFKDYGFFVPKNADGHTVIMEGVAKVEEQSVEWLQHKAKDANMSEEEIAAITEPEMSVSFMADGVIIKGEIPPMEEETEGEEESHDHDHEGEEAHTHE